MITFIIKNAEDIITKNRKSRTRKINHCRFIEIADVEKLRTTIQI